MNLSHLPNIIDAQIICGELGITISKFRRMCKRGDFPQPLRTGTRTKLWPKHALEKYLGLEPTTPEELPESIIDQIREIARQEVTAEFSAVLATWTRSLTKGPNHACT